MAGKKLYQWISLVLKNSPDVLRVIGAFKIPGACSAYLSD
jgi:hypothetical protein